MIDWDNPEVQGLTRELLQLVCELMLVSHAPAGAYDGKTVRSTDEDIGGRRPSGTDVDRPRKPRPGAIESEWIAYQDEREAWLTSYHRRTPDYFKAEVAKCTSVERLRGLRDEAIEVLTAWRQTPLVAGVRPSMADPRWKQWVAHCEHSVAQLVSWYPVSRASVYQIRRDYREVDSVRSV